MPDLSDYEIVGQPEPIAPTQTYNPSDYEILDGDVPRQHTYRESLNKTVDAPYGLTPNQIEYHDDSTNYIDSDFMRGMALDLQSMPSDLRATVDLAGYMTGLKEGGGLPVIKRNVDQIKKLQPRFGGFGAAWEKGESVFDSVGNIIDQSQEMLGSGVASTLPSLIGAMGLGAAGEAVAGPAGGVVGSIVGSASPSVARIPGQFLLELEDAAAEYNLENPNNQLTYNDIKNYAAIGGFSAAALDALPMGRLGGTATKKLQQEAIKKSASAAFKEILKATGRSAIEEGVTEGAQEAIQVAATSIPTGEDVVTPENIGRTLEAGVGGALTGGVLGGGTTATIEGIKSIPGGESAPSLPAGGEGGLSISETPLYHSTTAETPFAQFDLSKAGTSTDQGNVGVAVYLTPSTAVAQGTTKNQGSLIETKANISNPLEIVRDENYQQNIESAAQNLGVLSQPMWSGTKQTSPEFAQEFSQKAQESGYDSVVTRLPNDARDIVEVAVFDPNNVSIKPLEETPNQFSDRLSDEMGIDVALSQRGDDLVLSSIKVPESERGSGIGSQAMKAITDYADSKGLRIALTPTVDFGASSVERLEDFYKRFGFTTNQDTSLSETMVRAPVSPATQTGGGGISPPPPPSSNQATAPEPDREADYTRVANKRPRRDSGFKDIVAGAAEWGADTFVPVSTRLSKIDERLKHAVRRFSFDLGLHTHEDNLIAKPFIESVSKRLSKQDYRILDLALKNGDANKIKEITTKYGIQDGWQEVQQLLGKIYKEATDTGVEMGFVEDYFPRKVRREMVSEYLAFLKGKEEWSLIQTELDKADPEGVMSPDEKADFVNKWLRGYKNKALALSRTGFTKARSIDYIDADMNKFYEDSMPTLIQYISGMRNLIEMKKLIGGDPRNLDESIGAHTLKLVEDGSITPEQEASLRKILAAVLDPKGTGGFWSAAKNATYIYTMGSPISALTQLQDLAFSLHKNGFFRTGAAVTKALTRKSKFTKEDLGVSHILQEFENGNRSGDAVRKVFKLAGLSFMNNVGKETYINASWSRLRRAAKKQSSKFTSEMERVFGDEAAQVISDLKQGNVTEDTKYLLFSELSDVQPIALTEMPVHYLNQGNWRILYMLKSYTLKQLDIYRREIFDKLGRTSIKDNVEGLKNLVSLASSLMLMGMGTDALKDLILGREIDIDDLVMDNIYKTMGFTKWQIYKTKQEGLTMALWQGIAPPVGAPVDDIIKDINGVTAGDKQIEDMEIWQRIPIVGKFYYWWLGGGYKKTLEE